MTTPHEQAVAFAALAAAVNPPTVPPGPVQLAQGDLIGMSPSALLAAQSSGELDTLLKITRRMPPRVSDQQIGSAELAGMLPAEIVAAQKAGRLADLLAGRPAPVRTTN